METTNHEAGAESMGVVEEVVKTTASVGKQYGLVGMLLVFVLCFTFGAICWLATAIAQPWVAAQIDLMTHQVRFMDQLNESLENRQHETDKQTESLAKLSATLDVVQAAEAEKLRVLASMNQSLQENSNMVREVHARWVKAIREDRNPTSTTP